MPSWSIHLKIGKELLRSNIDKDLFLFGSLIPDTDYNSKKTRFAAHYYGNLKFPKCPVENMIDINKFLDDYKDNINNPLILGYYTHLLIDNYYNEYIYYNKWILKNNEVIGIKKYDNTIINISNEYKERGKYKHRDLELYGKTIFKNEEIILPKDTDIIIDSIHLLKDNFITKEDVINRVNYLNNDFLKEYINKEEKEEYILFTKEELDNLLYNCIKYIKEEYKKVGII